MDNITESMLCFRDAASQVWNFCLRTLDDPMSDKIQSSRDVIEIELLRAMVLSSYDIDLNFENYRNNPIKEIEIHFKEGISNIPAQEGIKDKNGNFVWSDITLNSGGENFSFLNFFDWNPYNHVSMNLIKMTSMIEGKIYLIEVMYCDFFLKL